MNTDKDVFELLCEREKGETEEFSANCLGVIGIVDLSIALIGWGYISSVWILLVTKEAQNSIAAKIADH